MNEIFYKYRSDSEYTEQIFTSGQVFLSTAEGLNDPFECSLQEIGKEWIEEKVRQMKQAAVAGFLIQAKRSLDSKNNFFGLWGSEIADVLSTQHKNIDEAYEFYRTFIQDRTGHPPSNCNRLLSGLDAQLNSVGIFSLSKKSDHALMWAHYAGEHTGVCIGFERVPGSRMYDSDHFLQVVYSESLPEMDKDGFQTVLSMSVDEMGRGYTSSLKVASNDKTFQRAITTKPTCWSYEEEWRYIEPYPGLFEWPGTVADLTFGFKCVTERREHYIELAEQHVPNEVRLFEIRKRRGTNSFERVPFGKEFTSPRPVECTNSNELQDTERLSLQEFVGKMERLIRQEKYGDALFNIDENLRQNPDSPVLLHLKGVAHGYANQHDKALECFRALTKVEPESSQGWYQVSCALTELGRHDEAVDALRRAFELNPNDASTALNLGIELLRIQKPTEEALIYLRRAEQLGHRRASQIIDSIAELEQNQER
jgi:tetratricopeptide (TPR) repeat protein